MARSRKVGKMVSFSPHPSDPKRRKIDNVKSATATAVGQTLLPPFTRALGTQKTFPVHLVHDGVTDRSGDSSTLVYFPTAVAPRSHLTDLLARFSPVPAGKNVTSAEYVGVTQVASLSAGSPDAVASQAVEDGRVDLSQVSGRNLNESLDGTDLNGKKITTSEKYAVGGSSKKPVIKVPGSEKIKRVSAGARKAAALLQKEKNDWRMVIPKAAFVRIVRDRARILRKGEEKTVLFQSAAIACLQESTERFISGVLAECNLCAAHAKRVTIMPKDLALALRLRGTKFSSNASSKKD